MSLRTDFDAAAAIACRVYPEGISRSLLEELYDRIVTMRDQPPLPTGTLVTLILTEAEGNMEDLLALGDMHQCVVVREPGDERRVYAAF